MRDAHSSLGDGWNACYLSAPIWRFTLPAGQAGPKSVLGVLMPSVDRVGRQFPLTLVVEHSVTSTALIHFANDSIFTQLENIALAALDEETSVAALAHSLKNLYLTLPVDAEVSGHVYSGVTAFETVLAANVFDERYGQKAVWTVKGNSDHKMILCDALPGQTDFMAMLDMAASLWCKT
jgi:type VI secretion system protein ImpM